jgi:hypothetical protein
VARMLWAALMKRCGCGIMIAVVYLMFLEIWIDTCLLNARFIFVFFVCSIQIKELVPLVI